MDGGFQQFPWHHPMEGYSALEKAVHKAYYKKKGIKVYYKIHKSVMSMNKVRYVVG